ncbi:GNAT family N-acetyltransferase [Falsirhodobacter algicola]|uniref:GNAT family N-acetyltransferase n=1 Tax=Falsirhodobacter algicola TaxID=2692330 RepID=A0A8J8MTB3_9RHOB|nr:GNAT family N-acetyltransferase [Falsirhodobacter algicola]QUS35868.1 GNAT family N-acetyltransferase [Falsirhodobacter algicola]
MTVFADHPVLETERLILRPPQATDYSVYAAFMGSPRSAGVSGPVGPDEAWVRFARLLGHRILRGWGVFIVTDRVDGTVLGAIGPHFPAGRPEPEIAWSLWDAAAEGRGIAAEAAIRVLDHVFTDLEWTTAVSYVACDNTRSAALAQRLGARIDPAAVMPDLGVAVDVWRHPNPRSLA